MKVFLNKRVIIIIIVVLAAFVGFAIFARVRSSMGENKVTVEAQEEAVAFENAAAFQEYMEAEGLTVFDRTSEITEDLDAMQVLFAYSGSEISDDDPCIIEFMDFTDSTQAENNYNSIRESLGEEAISGITPSETFFSGDNQTQYFAVSRSTNSVIYAVSDLEYADFVDSAFEALGYMGEKEEVEEETDITQTVSTEPIINEFPGVALEMSDFTEIMESLGYEVEDAPEGTTGEEECRGILMAVKYEDEEPERVYFYRFNDVSLAEEYVENADANTAQSSYKEVSSSSDGRDLYGIISRLDNTVVFAMATDDNEEDVEYVIECLGYDREHVLLEEEEDFTETEITNQDPFEDDVVIDTDDTSYLNLENMTFSIGDTKYTLGTSTIQDMLNAGVVFGDDSAQILDTSIEPGKSINISVNEDNTSLKIAITNTSSTAEKCVDCPITSLYLKAEEDELVQMNFPLTVEEEDFRKAVDLTPVIENIGEYTLCIYSEDNNIAVLTFNNGILDHIRLNYVGNSASDKTASTSTTNNTSVTDSEMGVDSSTGSTGSAKNSSDGNSSSASTSINDSSLGSSSDSTGSSSSGAGSNTESVMEEMAGASSDSDKTIN